MALFAQAAKGAAEVFALSLLGAITAMMMSQAYQHGRQIDTGFYQAYLMKGGFRSIYFMAFYLKFVLQNLLLLVIYFAFVYILDFQAWSSI